MAAVTIVMSADDARVQAAHNRLFAAQQKAIENYEKTINKSKEAQAKNEADLAARKAAAQAEKERLDTIAKGQKLSDAQRTAQQRYNDELAEAKRLYDAGAISAGDLATRMNVLKKELADATGETQRAKEAEAQLTEAHKRAAEVIKQSQTPLEKYNAKLAELKKLADAGALSEEQLARAQKQVKDEFDKTNAELAKKNTLLGKAGVGITAYVGGIASAAGAAALLRQAWQQINEEQAKGLDLLKSTEDADRNLLQISSTKEEFASKQSLADKISTETGISRVAAREAVFSASSEGFMADLEKLAAANQVIPLQSSMGVAGKIPALFQNQISSMESVDLLLKAAENSPLNFSQMATNLPTVAQGGAIANASPEETMASLSVLAKRFKGSGEEAANRLKAFATAAGIDPGSMTAEQRKAAEDRVESARKELRRKEEAVADIQETLASKTTKKEAKPALEKRLTRAQRDVEEFDRSRLEMPTEREELKGLGFLGSVKKLKEMSEADRAKFLGTSQELNQAYLILTEEYAAIESQVEVLKKERESFAKGQGFLDNKIAIASTNKNQIAILEEAKAQRRLEIAQVEESSQKGATASMATADAQAKLLRESPLGARMLGKAVIPAATAVGSEYGLSGQASATIGTESSVLGFNAARSSSFGSLTPVVVAINGLVDILSRQAANSEMKNAAGEINEAAKQMQNAADKIGANGSRQSPPPSIAPAARANAEMAGR